MTTHWKTQKKAFGPCTEENPRWLAARLQKALDISGLTQPGLCAELMHAHTSAPPVTLSLPFTQARTLFRAIDLSMRLEKHALTEQPLYFEEIQAWAASLGLTPAWRTGPGISEMGPTPTPPQDVQKLFHQFLDWLAETLKNPTEDPTVIAAEGAYALLLIQPFANQEDTLLCTLADIVASYLFLRQGYPPPLLAGPLKGSKASIQEALTSGLTSALRFSPPKSHASLGAPLSQDSTPPRTKLPQKGYKRSPYASEKPLMRVGTLARDTGETVATIRHWLREGILSPAKTNAAGFHLYNQTSKEQVLQIQALKAKRFTLQEIRNKLKKSS